MRDRDATTRTQEVEMEIVRAKRWTDGQGGIRYYIITRDEQGVERGYIRYITECYGQPAKSWADGIAPDAATQAEYRRVTNGGRKSYEIQNHF